MSQQAATSILVLGLNYAPEEIGIGPYTTGIAEHFASLGHKVEVVAGRPYYPQWSPFPGYRAWWRHQVEGGVGVTRCPHYIPRTPGGLKRLLHHASFALASLLPALRHALRRPDVVVTVAPSLVATPVAWLAARFGGAKLWLHVQDFEVEAAAATGLVGERSFPARLGRALERFILSRADLVTTISPQMCRRLREKGVGEGRVAELRNWANHLDAIATANGDALRCEWSLEGKLVALYSGNVANKQGLDVVIDAARLLVGRKDIAFVVCGEGPNRARLEERAAGLANIQFHGLQPAERFAPLMRMADVHLLPQLADAADLVLPSKLTNILASARPAIATAASGTGLAQEVEGCGLVVPPEDPEALAKAIATLADDPVQAGAFGKAAAERAEQRWRKGAVLAQANQLLARLTDGG